VNAVAWAQTALAGDYLAEYDDEPRDDDYGSRCGFDDRELGDANKVLRTRGLRLQADDRGLVAVASERLDAR